MFPERQRVTRVGWVCSPPGRYGYPVWLTEFSCGDGASGRPTKDHVEFMRAVLPLGGTVLVYQVLLYSGTRFLGKPVFAGGKMHDSESYMVSFVRVFLNDSGDISPDLGDLRFGVEESSCDIST